MARYLIALALVLSLSPVALRSSDAHFESVQEWLRASFSGEGTTANGPDTLLYCHYALGMMANFAKLVGGYSPIDPKMTHFGPHNTIGPTKVQMT